MRIRVIPWSSEDARVVGLSGEFEKRGEIVSSCRLPEIQESKKRASPRADASPKKKRVAFQAVNTEDDEFLGFKTLGGKKMAPSKEGLLRADGLFDGLAEGDENDDFVGFKTLSGKSMVASSESRAKAEKLFSETGPLQKGATVASGDDRSRTSSSPRALGDTTTTSSYTTPRSVETPSTTTSLRRRRRLATTSLSSSGRQIGIRSSSARNPSSSSSAPQRASAYRPLVVRNTQHKDLEQANAVTPPLPAAVGTPRARPPATTAKIAQAASKKSTTTTPRVALPAFAHVSSSSSLLWSVTASNADRVRFDAATGQPCDVEADSGGVPSVSALSVDYTALHLISTRKLDPALVRKTQQGKSDDAAWRAWVRNHYRWVVWKLASMERTTGCVRLTYDAVVEQLARRFRREFECAEKPAFRAILQHDAPAQRLLVVCVSEISSQSCLKITDGWYSLDAALDDALSYRVSKGSIRVGTKLAVCGARLEGNAIDPLDSLLAEGGRGEASHVLRLNYNGTRLARRDAKLGFQRRGCMTVPLRSVVVGQGSVPAFDAVVSRLVLPPSSSSSSENGVDAPGKYGGGEPEGESPWHLTIRLVAPGAADRRRLSSSTGPPIFAHLTPRTLELVEGDCALREGDLVRIASCDPWKTRADGTLEMRTTRQTRISRLASPAPRNVAAAAWYVPRSLAGCDRVADHLRNPQRSDNAIDLAALVVEARPDSLVVADASPYLVVVTLAADHEDSRRARALKSGDAVALLNLSVRRFVDRDDCVACDLTSETRVCATPPKLDNATSRHANSRLRDEFETFLRWSRGRGAAKALAEARAQLQLFDDDDDKEKTNEQGVSAATTTTPPLSSSVSASVLATLRSRSDAGATLTELRSEVSLSMSSPCHGTNAATSSLARKEENELPSSHAESSYLDAVIQEMQGSGLVYLDSDRVYLL